MDLVVHFKVEIATKVFDGITRFDCGDNIIIYTQLRLILERLRRKFLDPKCHTFIHSDDHV